MTSSFHFHEHIRDDVGLHATRFSKHRQPKLPLFVRAFWPLVYALILVILLLIVLTDVATRAGQAISREAVTSTRAQRARH